MKPYRVSSTPVTIDVTVGNIAFPVIVPGQPIVRFPNVTYSMKPSVSDPASPVKVTFDNKKLITVTAPKGQVLQFNFQLDAPSAASFTLLGIAFNSLPTTPQIVDASAGRGSCGQGEFPAIIVARDDPLAGILMEDMKKPVPYVVPQNTLSVVDVNLSTMESVKYSFIIMVQNLIVSPIPPPAYSSIGIIDPDIMNQAEE